MDISKADQISFVEKLIADTKSGKVTWEKFEPPSSLQMEGNTKLRNWYETKIQQREVGIFDEFFQTINPETDEYYWANNVILVLLDNDRELDWKFSPSPGLWDLMSLVKFSNSGVEDFVNEFLGKKKGES